MGTKSPTTLILSNSCLQVEKTVNRSAQLAEKNSSCSRAAIRQWIGVIFNLTQKSSEKLSKRRIFGDIVDPYSISYIGAPTLKSESFDSNHSNNPQALISANYADYSDLEALTSSASSKSLSTVPSTSSINAPLLPLTQHQNSNAPPPPTNNLSPDAKHELQFRLNDAYVPDLEGGEYYTKVREQHLNAAMQKYDEVLGLKQVEATLLKEGSGFAKRLLIKLAYLPKYQKLNKEINQSMCRAFYPQEYYDKNSTLATKIKAKKKRQDRLRIEAITGMVGSQDVTLRLWTVGLSSLALAPIWGTVLNVAMLASVDGAAQSFINANQEVLAEGVGKPQPMSFGNGSMATRTKQMKVLQQIIQGIAETDIPQEHYPEVAATLKKLIAEHQRLELEYKGARYRFTGLLRGQFWQNIVRTAWIPSIGVIGSIVGFMSLDCLIRSVLQTSVSARDGVNQAAYNRSTHLKLPTNIFKQELLNKHLENMVPHIGYQGVLDFAKDKNIIAPRKINAELKLSDLMDFDKIDAQHGRQRMARLQVCNGILSEMLAKNQLQTQALKNQVRGFELGRAQELAALKNKSASEFDKKNSLINWRYDKKIKSLNQQISKYAEDQTDLKKQLGDLSQIISYNQQIFTQMQYLRHTNQALIDFMAQHDLTSLDLSEHARLSTQERIKYEALKIEKLNIEKKIGICMNELYLINQRIEQHQHQSQTQTAKFKKPYHLYDVLNASVTKLTILVGKNNLKKAHDFANNSLLLGLTGVAFTGVFLLEGFSKIDPFTELDKISEKWDWVGGPSVHPIDVVAKSALSNLLLMSAFVPEFMANVSACFENIIKFGGSCYHQDFAKILIDKLKYDLQLAEHNLYKMNAAIRHLEKQTNKQQSKIDALSLQCNELVAQISRVNQLVDVLNAQIQNPESLIALLKQHQLENLKMASSQETTPEEGAEIEADQVPDQADVKQIADQTRQKSELLNWFNYSLSGLAAPIKANHLGMRHELHDAEQIAEHFQNQQLALGMQKPLQKVAQELRIENQAPPATANGFWRSIEGARNIVGRAFGRHLGSKSKHAENAVGGENFDAILDMLTAQNQDLEPLKLELIKNFEDGAIDADTKAASWANYWQAMFEQISPEQPRLQNILIHRLQKMELQLQPFLINNSNHSNQNDANQMNEALIVGNDIDFLKAAKNSLNQFLAKPELRDFLAGVQKEVPLLADSGNELRLNNQPVMHSLTSTAAYYASYNYQATDVQAISLNPVSRTRDWLRRNIYYRRFGLRSAYHFITKRLLLASIQAISALVTTIGRRKFEKSQLRSLQGALGQTSTYLKTQKTNLYNMLSDDEQFYLSALAKKT